MSIKKEIVIALSNSFSGDYISRGTNIGHEFINMYQSDNGNYYAYFTPGGATSRHVDYIVNVRSIKGQGKLQIISYAKVIDIKGLPKAKNRNKDKIRNYNSKQLNYIKEKDIRYGGKLLNEIYEGNTVEVVNGSLYFTFQTEPIKIAKKEYTIDLQMPTSSRIYLTKDKTTTSEKGNPYPKAFYDVLKHINDEEKTPNKDNWKIAEKLNMPKAINFLGDFFIDIIRKTDDENIISNIISYFLWEYDNFKNMFFEDILKLSKDEKIEFIKREYKNIDILIKTDKRLIVIEHKINSAIIKNKDEYTQLDKYHQIILEEVCNENSVLYVEDDIRDEYIKQCKFIVLKPNHNNIVNEETLGKSGVYQIINYSELNEVVNKLKDENFKYFDEFSRIVQIHSSNFNNQDFEIQEARLLKIINNIYP